MSSKPQSDPKSNPAMAPEGKKKKGGKKGKKGRRKKSPNNISMAVEIPVPKCTCFDAFMDSETKKCPKNGAESMGNMCVTHCAIDDEMDAETKQCNMKCLKEMKCLLKKCKAKCPPCSDDPKQQEKRKECIECCKEAVECRMKMCKANCTKCSPKYYLRQIPSACSNNSSCSNDDQRKKCLNEEDDYDTKKNREREKEDKNEEISQLCDELRTTLTGLIEDQKQVEKGLKIIRQQQTQYGEPNSQVTQDILRKNTQLVLEAEARCEEHRDQLMSSLQNFKCMMEGDSCNCPSEMEIDSVQIDKLVKILGDYDKKGLGVRLFCFYLYLLIYNIDVL